MAAAEQKKSYAVIKNFKGLNTKANRTAIEEAEFSWIENAMPIGFGNIKIVKAQTKITTGGGANIVAANTVTALDSANLNGGDYLLAFEDNGKAEYVNITSSTSGNIAVAGTFSNSGVTTAQYNDERIIIGDPSKGLFNWDGANLVSIGSVGTIGITNPGSGYVSAPAVTISPTGKEPTTSDSAPAPGRRSASAAGKIFPTPRLTSAPCKPACVRWPRRKFFPPKPAKRRKSLSASA